MLHGMGKTNIIWEKHIDFGNMNMLPDTYYHEKLYRLYLENGTSNTSGNWHYIYSEHRKKRAKQQHVCKEMNQYMINTNRKWILSFGIEWTYGVKYRK